MPATAPISDAIFKETITKAVQDVFRTMASQQAILTEAPEPVPSDESPSWIEPVEISGQHVVGTVGFIGDISGLIYVYLTVDLAREIAGKMLGMTPEELDEAGDEVTNDAVGEITNMTVGGFKNQLCDHGYPCRLTIPSILRGSNFTIEPVASAIRRVYRFQVGSHQLVADLLMKQGD